MSVDPNADTHSQTYVFSQQQQKAAIEISEADTSKILLSYYREDSGMPMHLKD
jgi:hypothetical protein